MANVIETDIKVPAYSAKTDPDQLAADAGIDSTSWTLVEEAKPSSSEQKARILSAISAKYEFGYTTCVDADTGKTFSRLYGRKR